MDIIKALIVLGLSADCSKEEVKKSYRELAKSNHPDIKGESYNKKFVEINEAYKVLMANGTSISMKLTHRNLFDIVKG